MIRSIKCSSSQVPLCRQRFILMLTSGQSYACPHLLNLLWTILGCAENLSADTMLPIVIEGFLQLSHPDSHDQ
jgi:hypothetical protein